ncbi:hypothetical protein [Neobacillus massiliamazoniensis]|nr:hypothetical protein [Neobacillus massiliamazoniensis]
MKKRHIKHKNGTYIGKTAHIVIQAGEILKKVTEKSGCQSETRRLR